MFSGGVRHLLIMDLSCPRFILSGASEGVGKTLLGIGIAHELRRQGVSVSCCVLGPNLVEAVIFRRLTGRYVHCLDAGLLTASQNLFGLYQASVGADIVMILGNRGLYDVADNNNGSDAGFAELSKTPAVLIVDSGRFGASVGALVKGFMDSATGFEVAAAIFNKAGPAELINERQALFENALRSRALPASLGVIPTCDFSADVPSRSVCQRENLASLPHQFFLDVGRLVSERIDLERLQGLARRVEHLDLPDFNTQPRPRRVRIAVSDDGCFNLCFQDNLDLLRFYGAELTTFSPMADEKLPRGIGGVYITGAFIDEYGEELESNRSMHTALKEFVDAGGVLYSEGAGTAYLCSTFFDSREGQERSGAGVLKGQALPEEGGSSLQEERMVTAEETILGSVGLRFNSITTGEWKLIESYPVPKAFRPEATEGVAAMQGYSPYAQVVSTFSFIHFGSNQDFARNFVDAAEVFQKI